MPPDPSGQPQISVALATYNGETFLRAQLDSLLAQAHGPSEIIVSDGGSTDSTLAILTEYARDGHLHLLPPAGRLGVRENFRNAVRHCRKGNLIAFSDQDDVWMPQKLSDSVLALGAAGKGAAPALVFTDLELVDQNLQSIAASFWEELDVNPSQESFRSLLFGNIVTGCTILMNPAMRQLFEETPPEGPTMHDAWLALIAFSFGKAVPLAAPLVRYRQHGAGVTHATNRRESASGRLRRVLGQLVGGSDFLNAELRMARAFSTLYADRLGADDRQTLDRFLQLETASFFRRKRAAIAARSYRYTGKN